MLLNDNMYFPTGVKNLANNKLKQRIKVFLIASHISITSTIVCIGNFLTKAICMGRATDSLCSIRPCIILVM